MQIAEIIDEGVKSKMAAAGLAGLIAGANLPDAPNDSTFPERMTRSQNVDPNCSGSGCETKAQRDQKAKVKFEVASWHPWRTGETYGYQVNLNIIKPVRLICRLYDSSNRVIGQSGAVSYSPGFARELISNQTDRRGTKVICQEVN
tara:strand:- start:88 stop:525 length:438 start_codon:yes stop_codon:yes gene_type:complete